MKRGQWANMQVNIKSYHDTGMIPGIATVGLPSMSWSAENRCILRSGVARNAISGGARLFVNRQNSRTKLPTRAYCSYIWRTYIAIFWCWGSYFTDGYHYWGAMAPPPHPLATPLILRGPTMWIYRWFYIQDSVWESNCPKSSCP